MNETENRNEGYFFMREKIRSCFTLVRPLSSPPPSLSPSLSFFLIDVRYNEASPWIRQFTPLLPVLPYPPIPSLRQLTVT